ncbi:LuxR C-terminal-related transcriptional regulator [Streptomyces inhibens]|uniref:LuxR C-terminal-related transcriptional regulator n=1 Tax=Streptomyces inhibens TaxID=2293571 RepID=UPI003794A87B
MAPTLIRHAAAGSDAHAEQARRRLAALSDREREIAAAVAEGLSNGEIGACLRLSAGTVSSRERIRSAGIPQGSR